MALREISIHDLSINPFDMVSKDLFLITSGTLSHYNTMTAGWGTMGVNWGKPVVNIFIRPQRYTYEFVEENDLFTLCFFDKEYQPALKFCGANSGRDYDKAKETGLTPTELNGTTAFEEANLVLVCKKSYTYNICPSQFVDEQLDSWYPQKDYHKGYFGEILHIYQK